MSAEAKDYPSLAAIGKTFADELSEAAGKVIKHAWAKVAQKKKDDGQEEAAAAEAMVAAQPETMSQIKDPVWQLSKLGFRAGAYATTKKRSGVGDVIVYKVIDVAVKGATLELCSATDKDTIVVPLDKVHELWKEHKGNVQVKVDNWRAFDPYASKAWQVDEAKGKVHAALRVLWAKHVGVLEGLDVVKNPFAVYTTKAFAANALILVPASQNIRADAKLQPKDVKLEQMVTGVSLSIQPMHILPLDESSTNDGKEQRKPWVAPFWFVGDGSEPNMHIQLAEVQFTVAAKCRNMQPDVCTLKIPVLMNTRALKLGEALVRAALVAKGADDASPAAKRRITKM